MKDIIGQGFQVWIKISHHPDGPQHHRCHISLVQTLMENHKKDESSSSNFLRVSCVHRGSFFSLPHADCNQLYERLTTVFNRCNMRHCPVHRNRYTGSGTLKHKITEPHSIHQDTVFVFLGKVEKPSNYSLELFKQWAEKTLKHSPRGWGQGFHVVLGFSLWQVEGLAN